MDMFPQRALAGFGLAIVCGVPFGILPARLRLLGICAAAVGGLVGWALARYASPPFRSPSRRRGAVAIFALTAFTTTSCFWLWEHLRNVESIRPGTPQVHALQAAQSLTGDPELVQEISKNINQKVIEQQEEHLRQLGSLTGFLAHRASGLYPSPYVGWTIWVLEFLIAGIAAVAVHTHATSEIPEPDRETLPDSGKTEVTA